MTEETFDVDRQMRDVEGHEGGTGLPNDSALLTTSWRQKHKSGRYFI